MSGPGWLVVAGLVAIVVGCWLDGRRWRFFYSRRAFEQPPRVPAAEDWHAFEGDVGRWDPVDVVRLDEEQIRAIERTWPGRKLEPPP